MNLQVKSLYKYPLFYVVFVQVYEVYILVSAHPKRVIRPIIERTKMKDKMPDIRKIKRALYPR